MKTLLGWHHLYDVMSEMIRYVDVSVRLPFPLTHISISFELISF